MFLLTSFSSCVWYSGINSKEFSRVNKDRDGSSFEKAIILLSESGSDGLRDEYQYLQQKYNSFTIISQGLSSYKGKPHDIIKIKLENGTEKNIYFDISYFFGKKPYF